MATNIFLGYPPENIKNWIIAEAERKRQEQLKTPLTFTAEEAGAKLSLQFSGPIPPDITLETSSTGEEGSWQPYTIGNEIILENVGDKIMFRNSSDSIQVMISLNGSNTFKINSGKMAASGNIMFLMDKTGELRDLTNKDYCYSGMFQGCTSLTQAPLLPATRLAAIGCYWSMFDGCTALTQVPALPAQIVGESCYHQMFRGCTSLTQAPLLSATRLNYSCYGYMFQNCTNIPEPKYNMSHMTFDQVANEIQNNLIFGEDDGTYQIQCSDKILIATFENWQWTITEG